jgi:hypothetical protein
MLVLCACEALAVLRFRHLRQHFLKPEDFEDTSISRILHLVHSAGLLNAGANGLTDCTKDRKRPKCKGHYYTRPYDFQHAESDLAVEFGFFRMKVVFICKKAVFGISSF